MDFNKQKQAAAEEAATDKWDKARLFHEKVVFCIRMIEEIDNPWFDEKKNSAVSVYQMTFAFIRDGMRNSIQQTYRVTPEMRILVRDNPAPWHNMRLTRYQTKNGSYGYELDQVTPDDSQCAWENGKVQVKELSAQASIDANLAEVNEILQADGFEPVDTQAPFETEPCTDETYAALTKGSLLNKSVGLVIIPPPQEQLTEFAGRQLLVEMRRQWASKSAGAAKSAL